MSQHSYCSFELWLCSEQSVEQHIAVELVTYIGKFSLSQSIAPAFSRPLQYIFFDGICDEVKLHSHRSTCAVSGLGLATQALHKTCLQTALP